MYLKSLSIRGFKSFADRTNLKFTPGIVVIVGPNGSGKSNLTDAVLWVLGEQSPKSLRGTAMEDVIFSGSASRSPLDVAEVTLTLDNSDGYLPIEYSEVAVTRRTFRSGESDYFINNSPCRLLDVQELLSDSGVGRDMYSIISQGRLEEVLNSKPEDRRSLVEEAAGVLKHKKRKERALRKLALMDNNLLRAKDVLKEVGRRLYPLKNQATRAQTHQKLTEKLRTSEVNLAVLNLKELQSRWDKQKEDESKISSKIKLLKEELVLHEDKIEILQAELEKSLFKAGFKEKRSYLQSIKDRLESSILLLEGKKESILSRLNQAEKKSKQLKTKKVYWENEIQRLADEETSIDSKLGDLYAKLAEVRRTTEMVKKRRIEADNDLREKEGKISANRNSSESHKDSLAQLRAETDGLRSKISFLQRQQKALKERQKEAEKSLTDSQEGIVVLEQETKNLKEELKQARRNVSDYSKQVDVAELNKRKVEEEFADIKAKRKVFADLSKDYGDFPTGASFLLKRKKAARIVGVVGEVLKVPKEYEKAIEAVLGIDTFCLITKTLDDAKHAISLLDSEGKEQAYLLPIDRVRERSREDDYSHQSVILATSVIRCKPAYKKVIQALLDNVWIVKDLDTAIDLGNNSSNAIFTTLEGEVVFPSGQIRVGGAGGASPGLLARKRELLELKAAEKKLESILSSIGSKLKKLKESLASSREEATSIKSTIEQKKHTLSSIKARSKQAKRKTEQLRGEWQEITSELEALGEKLVQNEGKISELQKGVEVLDEETAFLSRELEEVREKRRLCAKEEREAIQKVAEVQVEVASLSERKVNVKKHSMVAQREMKEIAKQLEGETKTLSELGQLKLTIEPLHKLFERLLTAAEAQTQRLDKEAKKEKSLRNIQQAIKENQAKARRLAGEIERLSERRHQIEIAKAQTELKVKAVAEKIVEEYNVPLEKALELCPTDVSKEEISAEVSNLKAKVARLGPVNPLAVEEYKTLEERYQFLSDQIDDLLESKRALNKIIKAIDEKIKTKFVQAFEEVNSNFQSVFSYLFPGGRAELFMTDPDNPLETGIDVEAQPTGKKLKRLSLLSGGEKALVSLALLFAVYYTRPSPFYILDEVEPALDDINLQRFIALLEKLRDKAQFFIISHQRRTMEIADLLYGVSMQADGVSKLISQKLENKVSVESGRAGTVS